MFGEYDLQRLVWVPPLLGDPVESSSVACDVSLVISGIAFNGARL